MNNKRSPSDIIMTDADWRVLDSLKVRNLQHLRGLNADLEKDIIRELTDGINAGEGMPDLSARISSVTNIAKTRADTIARTETINACIDGARQRYSQLGIEEVEVIACDDSRTCPICSSHDGKIYKLTDDANLPPYHPNCRCAIKAVVKKRNEKEELEKLKRRAEIDIDEEIQKNIALSSKRAEHPIKPYTDLVTPKTLPTQSFEPKEENVPRGVIEYTGVDYFKKMNGILRNRQDVISRYSDDELKIAERYIDEADDYLKDKFITNEVVTLTGDHIKVETIHRGFSGNTAMRMYMSVKAGDPYTDPAFTSWSLSENVAKDFANQRGNEYLVILHKPVKPGTRGVYLGTASLIPHEQEVLRPRGLIDTIDHIRKDDKTLPGRHILEVYLK